MEQDEEPEEEEEEEEEVEYSIPQLVDYLITNVSNEDIDISIALDLADRINNNTFEFEPFFLINA